MSLLEKPTIPSSSRLLDTVPSVLSQYVHLLRSRTPLLQILYALTPSWLRDDAHQDKTVDRGRLTNETAWLDGMRGIASIAVLNFHYLFAFGDLPMVGFNATEDHRSLVRLPFIRLCYDGNSAVCIFFIVSGYVCSLQALRRMEEHQHAKALTSLSRSAFRRGLRLFLPTAAMALIIAICAQLGIFLQFQNMMSLDHRRFFPGAFKEPGLSRSSSILGQLWSWASEMLKLMNFWNVKPQYLKHDPHLWTIGYEYRSSMYLYLTLCGTVFCKSRVRFFILIAAGILNGCWGRWEAPLFFGGAAIALHTIASERSDLPLSPNTKLPRRVNDPSSRRLWRLTDYGTAMWLMSYPKKNLKHPAPGFAWINHLVPSVYGGNLERFPKTVGALLLFTLLATSKNKFGRNASVLHQLYTSSFAQYMGRIMFAFYLVHGTILHAIGYALPHMIWSHIGQDTPLTYWAGLGGGLAISFVSCVWAADVFTREIDSRCARLTKWIEEVSFEKS